FWFVLGVTRDGTNFACCRFRSRVKICGLDQTELEHDSVTEKAELRTPLALSYSSSSFQNALSRYSFDFLHCWFDTKPIVFLFSSVRRIHAVCRISCRLGCRRSSY